MAVMLGGMAAILGFHAIVAGNSAQNRLASAAMGAAQSKLEEFRNDDFDSLEDGADAVVLTNPGLAGAFSTTLDRCWEFAQETPSLLRATVAVVRQGAACAPNGASLASLSTLIARNDPRIAARNIDTQRLADGDGRLIKDYIKPEGSTSPGLPGGFEMVRDSDGKLLAIYNPDTGEAIVPKNVNNDLKFAEINGNIIIAGSKDVNDVKALKIGTEGAATCRIYYPGYPEGEPAPPTVTAGGTTITYVQYSCVVADHWRRAIYLIPSVTEQVCVGYPGLQPDDLETDVLLFPGRQYYGFAWMVNDDGTKIKVPAGMRGATDGSAVIGSVCDSTQSCWNDTEVRGWIPGGHHYFLKSATDGQSCADAMTVLQVIDANITEPHSMYANVLFRNPHKIYCTNDKSYTNDLPVLVVGDEPIVVTDCYSYTRVSGFMQNGDAAMLDGWEINIGSTSRYFAPCRPMGRFGTHGGGYVCGYGEDVTEVRLTPFAPDKAFSPTAYQGLTPLGIPHDYVLKNFEFVASASDGTPGDGDPGEPGDGTELTACVNGAKVTANVQNNKRLRSIRFNGVSYSPCQESGQGSNTTSTCTIPVAVPFGQSASLAWDTKQGNNWISQPDKVVTIPAASLVTSGLDNGKCVVTGVSLP